MWVAGAFESTHRLRHHSLEDHGCGLDLVDEAGRLAEPHARIVGIAFGKRLAIARPFHGGVAFELVFMAVPAIREGIAADARRESLRPRNLPGNVRDTRSQGAVAVAFEDRAVMALLDQRFLRGPEARAD